MKYSRKTIYKNLLDLVYTNASKHVGSCLSCMDILISIYFHMKKKEDKVVLSKGHAAPALYIVLEACGMISKKSLKTFQQNNTKLPIHVPNGLIKKEIPFASGSLGHGLSLACGIAHAYKLKGTRGRVYCVVSDGECNEGQIWEAAQYASQFKLSNLFVFVDVNNFQGLGATQNVLGQVTKEKWSYFGWDAHECNGHSITDITSIYKKIQNKSKSLPKVFLCNTIKGFGLSFFENKYESHYLHITDSQYNQGLKEIENL